MVKTLVNRTREAARQTSKAAEKEKKRLIAIKEDKRDNVIITQAEECSRMCTEITSWYETFNLYIY